MKISFVKTFFFYQNLIQIGSFEKQSTWRTKFHEIFEYVVWRNTNLW